MEFKTASELIRYLDIPRPTLYRRAKKLGISLTNGTYTEDELEALKQPLPNRPDTNQDKVDVSALQQQLTTLRETVETQKQQLDVKDKQIEQANQATLAAQILQKDVQNRLDEINNRLEITMEQVQKPKQGFWARLFG